MKTKYTFSVEQIEEYLNTPEHEQEFVIDHLCFLNGLFDLEIQQHCKASKELEIEFLTACIEYQRRETRRIRIRTVFLRVKTWKVEVHAWVLKSVVDCLMSFGLVVRDEASEHLFQKHENEQLMKSFK